MILNRKQQSERLKHKRNLLRDKMGHYGINTYISTLSNNPGKRPETWVRMVNKNAFLSSELFSMKDSLGWALHDDDLIRIIDMYLDSGPTREDMKKSEQEARKFLDEHLVDVSSLNFGNMNVLTRMARYATDHLGVVIDGVSQGKIVGQRLLDKNTTIESILSVIHSVLRYNEKRSPNFKANLNEAIRRGVIPRGLKSRLKEYDEFSMNTEVLSELRKDVSDLIDTLSEDE